TQAASWLLECLSVLRGTGDMPALLAAFQSFSEALLLLSNLTAKRLEELQDCPRRKSLAQTLLLLQRCIPLLHAAKLSNLKHPWDRQVDLSEAYAFQLMERTVTELTSLLVGSTGGTEPGDRNGTFSQHRSGLLALLSCPDPVQLSDSELSTHVEVVVFHCMLLAESSRPELRLELVKRCWLLLQLQKSICSRMSQQEGRPGQSWVERSLEEDCHAMREELEALDQAMLTATLCQILDTFVEGEEPLRQLVEGARGLAASGSFPAGQGGFLKELWPLTATFFTRAQQMLRVAGFVLAWCSQTQTAREIRERAECLKQLLARLPPLLTDVSSATAPVRAIEPLQSLCRTWAAAANSLLRCVEETVSTDQVLTLSIQEMARHREHCEKALEGQDLARFSQHAAHLISWAQWAAEATTHYMDRATDPIFRNGLLVWAEQLASSILELKAVTTLCSERLSCLQTRDVFSKAVSCLVAAAHRVQDGLDGSNHPDILSPLREQVRSAGVANRLQLSPSRAGLQTVRDEAAVQEDILSRPSPRPGSLHPQEGDMHPVITALLAATTAQDITALDAACSVLLELSDGCTTAAREALPVAEPPQAKMLGQHLKILLLTLCVIDLARETTPRPRRHPRRLLQMALALSRRIHETMECLAAMAGPWYSLSQQVLGFILSGDFLRGKEALEETMRGVAGVVQLAEDIASAACGEGNPISPDAWESFLQVQAKSSCAQMNTKALLEKAASLEGSCRVGKAVLELHCVQWAVCMHILLGAVDGFIGSDILLLRELSAVRNQPCSPSLLAAVSENSLRLQEAARLSYLSCPEDCGRTEILALREEIKVLMEALLDASNTLLVSSLSTASLYVRFELLQRELALRAKALLLHLEKVNTEHLQVIREVLGPALAPTSPENKERSKQAFEEKASRLMANVRWVTTTLQDVLEASAQEKLLPITDHLLVLTWDAVGSASQLFQCPRDRGHFRLDSITWYWSALAHYLVTQLRAVQGISGHILQLIRQCLQNRGDQCSPRQPRSKVKLLPAPEPDARSHTSSAETCLSRSGRGSGAAREVCEMVP
ncbi:CTNA1 protein, partial [Bucorvus abyssinicus]|nr:CTNA1 protein [Bucorvus abyssinicus]